MKATIDCETHEEATQFKEHAEHVLGSDGVEVAVDPRDSIANVFGIMYAEKDGNRLIIVSKHHGWKLKVFEHTEVMENEYESLELMSCIEFGSKSEENEAKEVSFDR